MNVDDIAHYFDGAHTMVRGLVGLFFHFLSLSISGVAAAARIVVIAVTVCTPRARYRKRIANKLFFFLVSFIIFYQAYLFETSLFDTRQYLCHVYFKCVCVLLLDRFEKDEKKRIEHTNNSFSTKWS